MDQRGGDRTTTGDAAASARTRLESWKAVAAHFGRDVTTVRRWERREGLPIHRLFHEKLGSIYAFTDELDAWWAARTAHEAVAATQQMPGHAPGLHPEPSAATITVTPDDEAHLRARTTRRRVAGAAVALLLLAVLLGTRGEEVLQTWRNAGSRPVATPATAVPGVAVLPLVHAAGSASESYFTDGMTTALTAELAASKSLKVVAHTSAKRYRERGGRSLSTIAQELGVDWIVQGSVARTADRVRITVGLARADEERPVWSKPFERPIEGVLELQAEIAHAVMLEILGPDAAARDRRDERRPMAVDGRAYELYLRGEFETEHLNPVSLARAVAYQSQAVATDPGFAPAWAGLAKANLLQESWGSASPGERAAEVRRATLRALALDPHLADAHDVMGRALLLYDRDWASAEAAFRRAIAESPSLAVAHNGYSIVLQTLVRTDESLVVAAKARELDPMAAWAWAEEGRAFYRARRYSDAEECYKRALAIDPGFAPAVDRLVQLYLVQRRLPEARSMLAVLERLPSSRSARRLRALLAALEGDPATASRLAAGLKGSYIVHIALGAHDAAFDDLERAVTEGTLAGFTLGNPELDPLRDDPRFARIVTRMGLPVDRLVALGRPRARS